MPRRVQLNAANARKMCEAPRNAGRDLAIKKARHRELTAHARARYRCFLPDLAGLAGIRRARPIPDPKYFSIRAREGTGPLVLRMYAVNQSTTSLPAQIA